MLHDLGLHVMAGRGFHEEIGKRLVVRLHDLIAAEPVAIEYLSGSQQGRPLVALCERLRSGDSRSQDRRRSHDVPDRFDSGQRSSNPVNLVRLVEPLVRLANRVVDRHDLPDGRESQWSWR